MHIRSIKPDFFRHEGLYQLEAETKLPIRLAFEGLWCAADREGRFEWKPRHLKLDILPWDEVDFGDILQTLERARFVIRYEADGKSYGYIPTFKEHQRIPPREAQSIIPDPSEHLQDTCTATAMQVNVSSTPILHGNGMGMENNNEQSATADGACEKPPVVGKKKKHIPYPQHFESAYELYPRKIGKGAAFKTYQRDITTNEEYQQLLAAIERFREYHTRAGTKPGFLPYFSTFMSSWRDCLDPDWGASNSTRQAVML